MEKNISVSILSYIRLYIITYIYQGESWMLNESHPCLHLAKTSPTCRLYSEGEQQVLSLITCHTQYNPCNLTEVLYHSSNNIWSPGVHSTRVKMTSRVLLLHSLDGQDRPSKPISVQLVEHYVPTHGLLTTSLQPSL